GSEFATGIYSLLFTATDTAGNSSTDSSETVEVTCTSVTIADVALSNSTVYNNNTPHDVTVTANVTNGSCGTLDASSIEATIDGVTEPMTLSSGTTYSAAFDARADAPSLDLGIHTVYVTASSTLGDSETDSSQSITISDICDNLATDASSATIGIYTNGTFRTSLTTSIPSKMTTVDTIQLGSFGAAFYLPVTANYDGSFAEFIIDASDCGGSSDPITGLYTTVSYHNCSLSTVYDFTALPWSVSAELVGSTLGSYHTIAVNSSTAGGTGTNLFKSSGLYYINDGAGVSSTPGFTLTTGTNYHLTICGNP
ncbi:MAG: hypothetical protein WC254_06325, partial [Candidatus Woesearchaeota archaeon]